jgi:hypothetical protein
VVDMYQLGLDLGDHLKDNKSVEMNSDDKKWD